MNKNKAKIAAVISAVAMVLGFAGPAFAATTAVPADPSAGAMDTVQNGVIDWVTTYGAPVLFALILLGILVRLAVRWVKKAGRSV
jgi:hypothetical protein